MPRTVVVTPRRALAATVAFVLLWQATVLALTLLKFRSAGDMLDVSGWAVVYVGGLAWVAWGLERFARRFEERRSAEAAEAPSAGVLLGERPVRRPADGARVWNPFDPAAWYYGRTSQRLKQSLAALAAYSVLFAVVYVVSHWRWGGGGLDPYELPAGGGQEMMRQTVQVRKIIKKRFVINPYSAIKFSAPPPLDQIDMKFQEETREVYNVGKGADGAGGVGDGNGDGAGFGQGTGAGKVRFIRLRHADRGWDKNFGIGGDRNMLAEYAARTRHKVGEETEAIEVPYLLTFPPKKSPPLVYVSGFAQFPLSAADKRALKTYLLERHGMVFGDNLGGAGFHQNFIATMNEVTGVTPVTIARDDRVHQAPYKLPEFPMVVNHGGGSAPLGWKVDGRWVCYYHPGALSDAWRDDHAGIRKEIWEMCYQLGVNVIFYAHREYNTWLQSQK